MLSTFISRQNFPASCNFSSLGLLVMESNKKSVNIFIAVLAPIALGVIVWAVMGIPAGRVDSGVIMVAALTVFCSWYLRIQLPRANIHLTISDALVMLGMLLYGGEIAVILAVLEMTAGGLNLRSKGGTIFFSTSCPASSAASNSFTTERR